MRLIPMRALRSIEHDGQAYAAGDRFKATPIQAVKLRARRAATFASDPFIPDVSPPRANDLAATDRDDRGRFYKTRDLRAKK